MKHSAPSQLISLSFAADSEPDHPVPLNEGALKKLRQVPRLVQQLIRSFGSTLCVSTLWRSAVHVEIRSDGQLFELAHDILNILALSAQQISENAQRQPPLPVTQAVTHSHYFDLLHELALAYEKSGLVATLEVDGVAFALPLVPLTDFTVAEPTAETRTRVNQQINGLCLPTVDANVVMLANHTLLELPHAPYELSMTTLQSMIFGSTAHFAGWTRSVRKGVLRAEPGGNFSAQRQL